MQVNSFKDRNGTRVRVGDMVHYKNVIGNVLFTAPVRRIDKDGYYISVFVEGRDHPWPKLYVEKAEGGLIHD